MQLFHSATTPFGRKVMVLILESGLTDRVQVNMVMGNPVNPGTLPVDHNPLGKIPALMLDDGRTIYDSRVICRYLDDLAGTGLYPKAPLLWDTLTLEATADGLMDAAALMVYEIRVRPPEKQFDDWITAQWNKVARALDALERDWIAHLNGPLDMGQIAVGAALGYLDVRHAGRDWRPGHVKLADWAARFGQRASMQATVPVAN